MKKILLGAAAALAVAAPGIASADTSGNIDLSIGNTEYDGGGEFDQTNPAAPFSSTQCRLGRAT
jgi:hypothetical protein